MIRYFASFLLLASAPMLSACFQAESVACGDEGPICPAGWVCIAELSACINPVTTLCGNGTLDEGESCDDGNLANHDECNWDCQLPRCGDGFLDAPEVCDDGNTRNGDGCSADCASEEFCGDGYLNDYNHGDNLPPEECDEGGVNTATCNADCTTSICGDGKVNGASGEICDGGNAVTRTPTDTDECDRDCTPNECGDTYINTVALEQCDNGRYCANGTQCESAADCAGIGDGLCTTRDFDCCTRSCKNPQCGNGVFEPTCEGFPLEVCDDGSHCSDLRPCTLDSQCAGIGDGLCRPRNGTGCSGDCRFPETCGDGEVQDYAPYFELCDDGMHCSDGLTACTSESDCAAFEDTSCAPRNGTGCASNCKSREECGDGILNAYPRRQGDGSVLPPEICDDGKQCANGRACVDSAECADVAGDQVCRTRNADGCSNDCLSEEVCGDGIHNNYPHPIVNLRPIVGVSTIGIPIVRAEACDNGKNCADGSACDVDADCALVAGDDKACVPRDGDGCSADCLSSESCGDGYFNDYPHDDGEGGTLPAEICDDGNNLPDDGCSASCSSTEQCGNGIQDPGEECDEGADINGTEFSILNCTRNCTISACGNSRRDPGEQCDRPDELGGNLSDGPCNLQCVCNVCGDNVVNTVGAFALHCGESTALEECDTGGTNSATCNFDCTSPQCGDGIVNFQAGESCDEGPPDEPGALGSKQTTACNSDCSIAFCGDGKLNTARGELCDDGNNTNGDGCSADCLSEEICGDGTVNSYPHIDDEGDPLPSEVCDDGRHCSNGDSCDSDADCGDVVGDCEVRGGTGCSPDCLSFEICGDSYLSNYAPVNETCDDGNDASGDGCDGDACTVETGWSCPTVGMPCFEVCGDGLIVGDETCDDNDQEGGDGCSATCQTELGYDCPDDNGTGGPCSAVCGDFLIRGAETCDDGDQVAGDGCGATCLAEAGWDCPGVVGGVGGVCSPVCGDGVVAGNEECDDGGKCENSDISCDSDADCSAAGESGPCNPKASDGCSAICRVELGWECPESGGQPVGGDCLAACGDFLIRGDEECDDGNTIDSDGCDSTCQFEEGWECPAGFEVIGGECQEICGDGLVRGAESCDDANTIAGDGCDSACRVETGWDCPLADGVGGACSPDCGDGLIRGGETCDEGTDGPSGGCTSCVAQDGWRCPVAGGTGGLCATICGDGKIRGAETCDDTNLVSNDGCSALCAEESGWDCPGTVGGDGGGCTTVCGDGLIRGTETCDEGGSPSAGGCLSCAAQSGWSCPTAGGNGGTCSTVCGDRLVRGSETCDDGDQTAGDGCGTTCLIESGWACPTAGGVGGDCATVCGDGIVVGAEQCDDAGTASGDGCDSGCRAETPVVGDDTYRALDGDAPYVIQVSSLAANDSAWAAATFEADATTTCGGTLTYDDVAFTLTYAPSGSPTCGTPWNDGFSYTLCNPAFGSLCTEGDVTIALNRLPVLADASACMPVGSANTTVNLSTLFTDPDGQSVDVASIEAGPATGGTAGVSGTVVTWTPTSPSAAASFSVPIEACDSGDPSACDTATWSVLWNDDPVLDTDYGAPPTPAPKGQTVEILLKDLIVSPGSQPVVDGADTEKTWIATVIGSVTVSATENGTYASSATTAEGTCTVLSDKVTFATPSNAADALDDGCWVQVCEACAGGSVCTRQRLAFEVVSCVDTAADDGTDLGCTALTPICHREEPEVPPTCVECVLDTQCDPSEPVCNDSTFTCNQCKDDAGAGSADEGCGEDEPICKTGGGPPTCVECTAGADCALIDAEYDSCDTAVNICGECSANSDCNGGAGFCVTRDIGGTDRKVCVECTQDSECGTGEVCDPSSDTCVGCIDDTDCDGVTPICNLDTQVCVECDGNEDCTGGEFCDVDSGVCVGCLTDDDCDNNESGFICGDGGACGCEVAATHCPADYTCDSNVCVPPPVVATADTVGFALSPGTTEYALSLFLDNDDFADSTSFNLDGNAGGATACGGTVALGTGTVIVTPPADPSACTPAYQDSFTYEVCSEFDAEDCQSATVTVLYNRSPTVTDATTCVNVNTASLLLDAGTLYTDADSDVIGEVTVTSQPTGGNVGVANTDELTLTPTDASVAASFSTIFEVCDTRTADFWDAACDTATWTALWNDAPTLADLATTPTPVAYDETFVVDLATLLTTWGTVQGDASMPLDSLTVSATESGTYAATASPAGGGTCAVVGETVEYTAPASGTSASCWVQVCEACGSTPSCVKTEVVFALQECVPSETDPDPGCGGAAPVCDTNGTPVCVVCIDDGDGETDTGCDGATPACDDIAEECVQCTAAADCDPGEVCNTNVCEPEP